MFVDRRDIVHYCLPVRSLCCNDVVQVLQSKIVDGFLTTITTENYYALKHNSCCQFSCTSMTHHLTQKLALNLNGIKRHLYIVHSYILTAQHCKTEFSGTFSARCPSRRHQWFSSPRGFTGSLGENPLP